MPPITPPARTGLRVVARHGFPSDAHCVGFTATRRVREKDRLAIARRVYELPPDVVLVVGGCQGGDDAVARAGTLYGRHVHAVIPSLREQVDPEWRAYCSSYEELEPGAREPYRERNQRLVDLSDEMIAWAEYPEAHYNSKRSGTWMTIRMAWRAGVPIEVHILRDETRT